MCLLTHVAAMLCAAWACGCLTPALPPSPAPGARRAAAAKPIALLPRQTGVLGLITFVLPAGAGAHDVFAAAGGQYLKTDVYVSGPCPGADEWARRACTLVALERRDGPGWTTLAEAASYWDFAEGERRDLGAGVTESGIFYAIRSFQVRTGFTSEGDTLHRWETVSRVHAELGVGARGHVECTGYLERAAESAADPDIQALLGICTSMRRAGR